MAIRNILTNQEIEALQNGPDEPAVKHDAGKLPWHLLPWRAVQQIVQVLQFGAGKYGPNNWQGLDGFEDRYFAATLRHLVAWREGEAHDQESGLHHLAHAACNLVFLLWKESKA
jgi:hypothetical protein